MHVLYCKQQIQLGKLGLQVLLFIPFVSKLFKKNHTQRFHPDCSVSGNPLLIFGNLCSALFGAFPSSCLVSTLLFLVIKLRLSTEAVLAWSVSVEMGCSAASLHTSPAQVRPHVLSLTFLQVELFSNLPKFTFVGLLGFN